MKYSIITFDDNTFFNARLTNNDMVCIERYIRKNPLTMFLGIPPLGDLAFIIYMSLRESSDYTLDDIYEFIDDCDLSLNDLIAIVIQLFKDMGFIEDEDVKEVKDTAQENDNSSADSHNKKEESKSFKKIANEILDQYLLVGSAEEFWDSNLDEVTKAFSTYKKQLRSKSESDYMLAMMTSTSVGLMLGGKSKKMPRVDEFFPGLYSQDELSERENSERDKTIIANLSEFGNRINEKRKAKEFKEKNNK